MPQPTTAGAPTPETGTVGLPPMFEVAAHARRARLPAVVFGVGVLIATAVLGRVLIGVGACIGLGLGMANAQLLQASMLRFSVGATGAEGAVPGARKQFALGGFARLAVATNSTR